jgi:signal transduction histidine kinase
VRARVAWLLVGATGVAIVLDTVFTAAHLSLTSEATWADHGWPLAPLASAGCAVMGVLILSRYPRHPLGWLLIVASLLAVTLAGEAYSSWVLEGDGPGSPLWAQRIGWAAPFLGWPAFTALIMIFILAPDGHLPSRRWRWAVWVTGAGLALRTVGALLTPPSQYVKGQQYHGSSVATVLLTVGYLLVATGLIASAASLVLRLRRSKDDERRQLLWIASAATLLAVGVVVILVVPRLQGQEGTWLAGLPLKLAQVAVPVCVAVAVLRHRLMQIDLVVNRAAMLALATAVVAVGYVVVVVVTGLVVTGGVGGFWPSVLATAVVAVAFQPARRWIVRIADRLAFGDAAAPYEALADFSRNLGERPDPSALLPALAHAAGTAVSAQQTTVRLQVTHGPDPIASWTQRGVVRGEGPTARIPIVHAGHDLGSLTVAMPAGRPLRPRDLQLLADLADQAALGFHNARLSAELAGQVEQLRRHTLDLTESRKRLITAGDAERSRLEHAIAQRVLFHLNSMPQQLRELSAAPPDGRVSLDVRLVPLVSSLTSALEALREITRGVFPAQLTRSGLPSAVSSLLARASRPGRLVVGEDVAGRRFAPSIEAAAYFCIAEAARELEQPVLVRLGVREDHLDVVLTGGNPTHGLSVFNMRDRVDAVGGSIGVRADAGHTTITVDVPPNAPDIGTLSPTGLSAASTL